MTREEAKDMAMSRDCHCVNGKDRDNNYNEVIDKIFDYHENKIEKLQNELTLYKTFDNLNSHNKQC